MKLQETIEASVEAKRQLLEHCNNDISDAANLVTATLIRGGCIFLCGNGGSAADAQHIAAEFTGRFEIERNSLAAIALTTDTSALTAIANDYGYERVFSRQLAGLGKSGDLLIGISTSGNSANVVSAFETAQEMQIQRIALTGSNTGKMTSMADVSVQVPSERTARIQESHILIGHHLCSAVDSLFHQHREAIEDLERIQDKAISMEQLKKIRPLWRDSGVEIAWTNGCFDLLHAGHVAAFKAAKKEADILIVGVNSDASVQTNKGPSRPVMSETNRANLIAAIEAVDYVVVFDEATPEQAIEALKPDVHCKGTDYQPPHGKPIPERELVEGYGGRIVYTPLVDGLSTTQIISRIKTAYDSP